MLLVKGDAISTQGIGHTLNLVPPPVRLDPCLIGSPSLSPWSSRGLLDLELLLAKPTWTPRIGWEGWGRGQGALALKDE